MQGPHRSDRSFRALVKLRDLTAARRLRQDPERGQALVEFALILIPLLILVVGIIQFGIGLNFWLDQQRIANQGARWAVVNSWPGCSRTQAANTCNATPACGPSMPNTSLANYLKCQTIAKGLRNNVTVTVCFPDDGDPNTTEGTIGTPVRVQLDSPFKLQAIMKLATINLRAKADMRLESDAKPSGAPGNKGHVNVGGC